MQHQKRSVRVIDNGKDLKKTAKKGKKDQLIIQRALQVKTYFHILIRVALCVRQWLRLSKIRRQRCLELRALARVVFLIQCWWRKLLQKVRLKKIRLGMFVAFRLKSRLRRQIVQRREAAITIQRIFRGVSCRSQWNASLGPTLRFQRMVRKCLPFVKLIRARHEARALRLRRDECLIVLLEEQRQRHILTRHSKESWMALLCAIHTERRRLPRGGGVNIFLAPRRPQQLAAPSLPIESTPEVPQVEAMPSLIEAYASLLFAVESSERAKVITGEAMAWHGLVGLGRALRPLLHGTLSGHPDLWDIAVRLPTLLPLWREEMVQREEIEKSEASQGTSLELLIASRHVTEIQRGRMVHVPVPPAAPRSATKIVRVTM